MKTTKQILETESAKAEWRQALLRTATEHREADKRCGREWECSCGACRIVRNEIRIRFAPITTVEDHVEFIEPK